MRMMIPSETDNNVQRLRKIRNTEIQNVNLQVFELNRYYVKLVVHSEFQTGIHIKSHTTNPILKTEFKFSN